MNERKRHRTDQLVTGFCAACAALAIIPLLSILWTVAANGLPALQPEFFTQLPKPVGETGGGMANAIIGTGLVVIIACLISLPIGILSGVYLAEFGQNRFGRLVSFTADVLTGTPSIVAGIFAYTFIVLNFGSFSALAGGVALSILMIPSVCRTTEESLNLVPSTLKEAALALGIPKWKVTRHVVIKTAQSGMITGVLLSIARISGETAPLLFTALGNMYWTSGINQPTATLPVQIYTYALTPFADWHAKAWTGALLLVVIILALNIVVRAASQPRFEEQPHAA